uniref:Metalloendopeptidase n=1 Tax=Globodera rostochiensis TaxID=31243 RepID=A0A914GWF2_GLORO
MVWALFSLCFCLGASGSTLPPLNHLKLHFRKRLVEEHADLFPTMAAVDRYLDNMNKLNRIQQKLHNFLSGELEAGDGIERRETEHFAEMVATAESQSPDQLPYLFEGDIVLTDGQMDELLNNAYTQLEVMRRCSKGSDEKCGEQFDYKTLRKRTLTSNLRERWNSFPIPYFVDPKVNRTAVEEGLANWMRSTCLTFREVSSLGDSQAGLQFVFGSGQVLGNPSKSCYSAIGKLDNGRPQKVSIGAACDNPFVVSHEIAHSLGYFHEQSRFDRNDFVRVQVKNIKSGFLNQFTSFSRSQENTFGVPYDFGSVMHYNAYAFSSSGLSSIQTLNSNYQNTIGQRFQLSFNDIKKMNLAYCDSICPFELPCQRSGYTDPKACERCRCPDGLSGRFCDRMAITNTECGELHFQAADRERTLSHFGAPIGARVALSFDSVRFVDANTPCQKESYVEVRYRNDLGSVGARFCESDQKGSFVSESNEVIVLYRSASKQNSFGLRYQRNV